MRMFLLAYVCPSGRVTQWPEEGSTTFLEVFNNRPSGCRYAVVRPVRVWGLQGWNISPGQYWLIDLFDARIDNPLHWGSDIRLGNYQVFPTKEAAIMAGVLTHDPSHT